MNTEEDPERTQDGYNFQTRNTNSAKIGEELNTLIKKSKSQWK
jgi:hypothetical protein